MVFTLHAACGCLIGPSRCNNEDNFLFQNKHLPIPNRGLNSPLACTASTEIPTVFSVFDGIGGECKGEDAAFLSSEVFRTEYKKLEELALPGKLFLQECCQKANAAVNQFRRDAQLSATGSTVAAIYFSREEVVSCNVGDSKIFRIRHKQMTQISEDHTDEKIMSAMGIQKKPVLLQYLGVPDTQMAIQPYITKGELESGDIYVLCSDGITDVIDVGTLYSLISSLETEEAVEQITAKVNCSIGSDNATIIVIKIV